MKKRILAGMMMMVLVLASAMSVSAANSKEQPVYASGESKGKYVITEGEQEFAKKDTEDAAKHTDAINKVKDINAGKKVSINTEIDKALDGKTLVQKFFDLDAEGDHSNCKPYHTIELTISALTSNCKNVVVLHYSQDRQVWETVTPTKVEGSVITLQLADLSPLAVYADVTTGGAAGTSPSTEGISSTWMLYAAAALIVLGAGVVVSQKKRG